MRRDLHRSFVTLGLAFVLAAGCKSSGPDRLDNVVRGLKNTRDGLLQGQKQIDTMSAALGQLVTTQPANLRPAFDKFTSELSNTQSMAADIRSRADAMKARGAEHLAAWEAEMATISNPQIRALSEERRRAVREKIDSLAGNMRGARESFQPFMKDLEDIQKMLSNDLTGTGVATIKPIADGAIVHKDKVQQHLSAVTKELDEIATALSAGSAAPAPASAPAPAPAQ
jgi:hypothetical protein